jgi:hypothetical protein
MPQHNNSDSLTDARKRNETSKNRFFEWNQTNLQNWGYKN